MPAVMGDMKWQTIWVVTILTLTGLGHASPGSGQHNNHYFETGSGQYDENYIGSGSGQYHYENNRSSLHYLKRELKEAVHRMVVKDRPNQCPKGTTFCMSSMRCIPERCKSEYNTFEAQVKRMLNGFMDKRNNREQLCPAGMTFCLENNQCVRPDCKKMDGGDGKVTRDNLKAQLQNSVAKFIAKKTRSQDSCPHETVFCLETHECVRIDCKDAYDDDHYRPTLDDIRGGLESQVEHMFGSMAGRESVCGDGLVFCATWGVCVSPGCSRTIDNYGECPQLADVGICSMEQECLSDSEGCEGNDKCCPNPCGGSSCVLAEIPLTDLEDSGNEEEAYKVTAYNASFDPYPVKLAGGRGLFGSNAPNSLKFYVSTASAGCVWKKLVSEEVLPNDNGGSEVIRTWAAITEGEVLDKSASIASIPINISFHGLTKVTVKDVEGNKNYTLAVLIHPVNVAPNITLNGSVSTNIILREDERVVNFTLPVNISSPMSLTRVKMSTEDMLGVRRSPLGDEMYLDYKERVEKLRKSTAGSLGVYVKLLNVRKEFGTISLVSNSTAGGRLAVVSLKSGAYGLPIFNYEPKKDFTGTFTMVVVAWSGSWPVKAKDVSKENVTFNIEVVNVNDAPQLPDSGLDDLQFAPRKMWTQLLVPLNLDNNEGILVSEIVSKFFTDPDGGKLGLCFLRAANSDLGMYQYKPEGADTWTTISVADPSSSFSGGVMSTFNPKQIAQAYDFSKFAEVMSALQEGTLPAYDGEFVHECQPVKDSSRFRFKLKNAESFWPYNSDTKWDAMAWDQSVEGEEGEMIPITLPLCSNCTRDSSPLSYAYLSGDAMRLGCNDKASPVSLVFDDCGECGGDGSKCVDCNGDLNGDAIMNQCGTCVLGNTGIADPDSGRDCKGGCTSGEFAVFDQLDGACLPADTDWQSIIQKVYCDGVWRGGAKIDSCGNCTGGSTGLERDFAKDACGICRGDGSSCTDCGGVVNGRSETDVCGQCLLPDDASFNKGCSADIGSFEPEYGLPNVAGFITIYAAALTNTDSIECSLQSAQTTVSLQTDTVNRFRSIIYTSYEAIDNVGTYSVKCTIEGIERTVEGATFKVILPEVRSLAPSLIEIGSIPSEVVLTGTGFVSTGEEVCFTNCPARISKDCRTVDSVAVVEAKVIDSTTVHCIIPNSVRKGLDFGISLDVSFAINDPRFASPEELAVYTTQQLVFTAPAPQIVSAAFLGACKVAVVFDMTISEVDSCENAFDDASFTKLGTDPVCFVRGSQLMLVLGTGSTLAASDSLTLKEQAIRQRNTNGNAYASGSVTVETSSVDSVKFEYFQAPQVIGNCDGLVMRAKFQGAACSDLVYIWSVELVEESGDIDVGADLDDVAATLASINTGVVQLTADNLMPGHAYLFHVYTTTHLGERSETKTKMVERKETAQELTLDLGTDKLDFNPNKDLRLFAKVQKSDCAQFEMTGVQYLWNSATADFSLEYFTSVTAKVPAGSMRGGKTYEITLMAVVTNDPSITAEASLTVTTVSNDLEPKIKRAPIMQVGVGQEVSLDASASSDPDRAEGEITYYVWTCEKITFNDALEESYQPCEIPEPGQEGTYVQFEDSVITEDELAEVITIPAYTLDTLSSYKFTLLMSKGDRSASESILVQVKEGRPPLVNIDPIEGQHPYGEDLYISARITSQIAFTASWSSASAAGLEQLEYGVIGEDSTYDVSSGKKDYPVTLKVAAANLKEGATYRLVLTVEHQDSDAEAQIDVTVNAPPTCASLKVSPDEGTALTDEFTLEVSGCEDELDDFPLTYQFFARMGEEEHPLTSAQLDSLVTQVLSKGNFSFRVEVCDQQGACRDQLSEGFVLVTEVELTEDFVNDLASQIEEQRTLSGSSDVALATIGYLVGEDVSDALKQTGLDIAKDEAKNTLSKANPQADPEGCADSLNSARDTLLLTKDVMIDGVKQPVVDSSTSEQLMNKSTEAILAIVLAAAPESDGNSRKKRAAEEGSSINPIDIETGEDMVLVQVTALEETAEEDIDKSSAVSFFDTLELVWQGVCADIISGQEPQVGKSSMLTFRAHLTAFDSMANASMSVSCTDCEEVATPANFSIGQQVASVFGVWNCTDDETCYGGCLATGQLNYDILTATSDAIEPYVSARLSDIIAIHLINPSTYAFAEVSNLTTPIQFTIQLTSTPQTATYEYMCRGWDSNLNDWSDQFCLAAALDNSTDNWVAKCSCYSTGYFAVFEGAEIIDPALFATTEAFNIIEETTTTVSYLNDLDEDAITSVYISFRIDADHALLDSDYDGVETDVLLWLTDVMNVTQSRLTDLLLTQGSIKVEFDFLPGSAGQTDINHAIGNLERRVLAAAAISIMGTSYNCIAEALVIEVKREMMERSTMPIDPAKPGIGLIIGIAVGGSLLIILIVIVVAAVIIKKNNTNNKIQNSPRSSEAQLPVVDDYELKKTTVSPEEEALYGPAPTAHLAQSVRSSRMGSTVLPIGSRPGSTNNEKSMTPVDSGPHY